jgi:hypothetical protein
VILHIPRLNVAGTARCNLEGINLSYAINTANGQITGAEDFHGAEDYLSENFATARISPTELVAKLGSQALPPQVS